VKEPALKRRLGCTTGPVSAGGEDSQTAAALRFCAGWGRSESLPPPATGSLPPPTQGWGKPRPDGGHRHMRRTSSQQLRATVTPLCKSLGSRRWRGLYVPLTVAAVIAASTRFSASGGATPVLAATSRARYARSSDEIPWRPVAASRIRPASARL
jgi:hypothetical protein